MSDLVLNDPVHVSRDNRQLEGVVAYFGPVDFDAGEDWIGVRLTGASVGLGKNDGSVQGKVYFSCTAQCGLFVKRNLVTKRQLTRLEELRLKRELATSGPGVTGDASNSATSTSSTTTTATPRKPPTPPIASPTGTMAKTPTSSLKKTPSSSSLNPNSAAATTTTTTTTTTATRLEEIRQRRAHLSGRSSSGIDDTKPDPTKAMTAEQMAAVDDLKRQLEEMESSWKHSQEMNEQLKKSLGVKEQELSRLSDKLNSVQQDLVKAKTAAVAAAATSTAVTLPVDQSQHQQQLEDLQSQLERVTTELKSVQVESQQQLDSSKAQIQSMEVNLAKAQAEAHEWQKRCQQQEDNNAAVSSSLDATHFKERAKLQAQVASLNRRVEQLEADKMDLEHTVEELALDKDQLMEEKETLEDRYEELKLDSETALMEAEELKMELEHAKAASELVVTNSAGTTSLGTVGSRTAARAMMTTTTPNPASSIGISKSMSSSSGKDDEDYGGEESRQAEDMASNLSIQNARLREALIRLREQSAVQQMELSRQLRTAEKKANEAQNHLEELQNLRTLKQELEEQISELKEMVDQGSAYEVMVEDLSDRVLGLEEELVACQQLIRELEEAADITAEMEEVQTDELKSLNRDLEDRESIIRNLEEAIKM